MSFRFQKKLRNPFSFAGNGLVDFIFGFLPSRTDQRPLLGRRFVDFLDHVGGIFKGGRENQRIYENENERCCSVRRHFPGIETTNFRKKFLFEKNYLKFFEKKKRKIFFGPLILSEYRERNVEKWATLRKTLRVPRGDDGVQRLDVLAELAARKTSNYEAKYQKKSSLLGTTRVRWSQRFGMGITIAPRSRFGDIPICDPWKTPVMVLPRSKLR